MAAQSFEDMCRLEEIQHYGFDKLSRSRLRLLSKRGDYVASVAIDELYRRDRLYDERVKG